MSVSVKVKCFHSGRFKDEGGLCYVDGTVDEFELDADSLFTNLVMKMFEKRIVIGKLWFKLPFHELEDRKPLFENVEANKKRMESSARWYKELDIYVERDRVVLAEEGSTNVGVQERVMNVEPEEEGLHDRAEKQCEKLCEKLAEKNSETGLMFDEDEDEALDTLYDPLADDSDDEKCSEDALSESSESNDEAEVVEEDIVDIDNVNYEEQIPDEDEVYPATDDSSGHNSRTCPTESPETREKRRRLSKQCEEDAEEAAARNGQDEANDEAQETAEMEADLAAQMEDQVEVEFISSTAPQPSQPSQGNQAPQRNLRRSSRLAALLFG
ncbi:hypothetical protein HID58_007645 [Brassica napus]|uniref:Uncharacterized protein n=2 Tax=Brassica napus TaxID=3708 RepID=A0ABQ8EER5_BRANA|nr:hypothetical protein HID58_007645 [Brassica napus]